MKIHWAKRSRRVPERHNRRRFTLPLFKHSAHARPNEPGRHKKLTFVGDEGRPWRIGAICAGIAALLVLIISFSQPEPQLMKSAEMLGISERGIVKVGVRGDMPGMNFEGEGLEIELAELLSKRMLPEAEDGNGLKLVTITSGSVSARLSDGTIDVALAMLPKDRSASQYAYSDAYYSDECIMVVATGTTLPSGSAEIGCIQNSASYTLLNAYINENPELNYTVKLFAGYDDMLLSLTNGHIKAVAMTRLYLNKYSTSYDIIARPVSLGYVQYALACPLDSSSYASIMNIMLDEMRNDGSLDALLNKYGLAAQPETK